MNRTGASSPVSPLFVWEPGDLSSYEGVEELERSLEAIDVRDGVYRAFDAAGRLLQLDTRVRREKFLHFLPVLREEVIVSLAEEEPFHREELQRLIVGYLESVGETQSQLGQLNFDELVMAADKRARSSARPVWWLRR